MAVNESRSMNADLREGLSDGYVKKFAPDRGGVVEALNAKAKNLLHTGLGHYDISVSTSAADIIAHRQTCLDC